MILNVTGPPLLTLNVFLRVSLVLSWSERVFGLELATVYVWLPLVVFTVGIFTYTLAPANSVPVQFVVAHVPASILDFNEKL